MRRATRTTTVLLYLVGSTDFHVRPDHPASYSNHSDHHNQHNYADDHHIQHAQSFQWLSSQPKPGDFLVLNFQVVNSSSKFFLILLFPVVTDLLMNEALSDEVVRPNMGKVIMFDHNLPPNFHFLFSTSFHPSIFPISWNSPSAQMTIFARLSRWIQPLWTSRVNLTIMHEYDQRPMRPKWICARVSYQTKCRNVWLRCIASSGHHRHHHQAWFKYLNKASTSVFNILCVEKYWPIIVKGVEMFPNGLTWLPSTTWSPQSPSTPPLSPAVITADHHWRPE